MKRLLGIFAVAAASTIAAGADDGKPAIQTLFCCRSTRGDADLPDALYLAAPAPVGGKQNIVIIDLANHKAVPITDASRRDIGASTGSTASASCSGRVRWASASSIPRGGGIFAIDRDGSQVKLLGKATTTSATPAECASPSPDGAGALSSGRHRRHHHAEFSVAENEVKPGGLYRVRYAYRRKSVISRPASPSANSKRGSSIAKGGACPHRRRGEFGAHLLPRWRRRAVAQDR
jgi:hypothetical protein